MSQVCLPVGSHGPRAPFAYACDHLVHTVRVQMAMLAMLSTSSRFGDFVHLVRLATLFQMLLHSHGFPPRGPASRSGHPPCVLLVRVGKRSPFRVVITQVRYSCK